MSWSLARCLDTLGFLEISPPNLLIIRHIIWGDRGAAYYFLLGYAYELLIAALFGRGEWDISRAPTVPHRDRERSELGSGLSESMIHNLPLPWK